MAVGPASIRTCDNLLFRTHRWASHAFETRSRVVGGTTQYEAPLEQVVFVSNELSRSFVAQEVALANYLNGHFRWPSPDAGFALHVFNELGVTLPFDPAPRITPVSLNESSQAPDLAAAGYFSVIHPKASFELSQWSAAFARLAERDPFPIDRLSFAFRPIELLGIAFGANRAREHNPDHAAWLAKVLNDVPSKCAPDFWASCLVAASRIVLALPDESSGREVSDRLTIEDLALLLWVKSSPTFRSGRAWSGIPDQQIQSLLLARCLEVEPRPADEARAALIYCAIRIATNSLLQSEIARNWQIRSITKDVLDLLSQILRRFGEFARQLANRHEGRSALEIKDEYDVQDSLHAILRLHFDDVRPEEWTPSYGGIATRMDFLLNKERLVVETKMTRKNLRQKELVKQLIEDKAHYAPHPDCDALFCFVYDPDHLCANPVAVESDLSEDSAPFRVRVVVVS